MANCPKCNSEQRLEHLRVIGPNPLQIQAFRNPGAILFTEPVSSRVEATVCAGCGFTELFALRPKELADAVSAARQRVNGR